MDEQLKKLKSEAVGLMIDGNIIAYFAKLQEVRDLQMQVEQLGMTG
ncbi:MAG: hypothetical protein P8J32_04475 [bacterium]|nr:hypothetical protein [bacterium]